MPAFILRRIGVMLLTALALTFVVFYLTNLPPNLEKLAKSEASVRMTDDAVVAWLAENGHSGSIFSRFPVMPIAVRSAPGISWGR